MDSSQTTASQRFYAFLTNLLNMAYYSNESPRRHHENEIECLLKKHGFVRICKKSISCTKQKVKKWTKSPKKCPLKIGEFIVQPCGTQDSPDFLIRVDKKTVLCIEAKSNTNPYPMYNSGGIKNNYLYIFSSKKYDKTTIYWGRDVISREEQEIIEQAKSINKNLDNYNNKLKKCDNHGRGWYMSLRLSINQKGGKDYTDYFKHPDREFCEQNVLDKFKNTDNQQIYYTDLLEQIKEKFPFNQKLLNDHLNFYRYFYNETINLKEDLDNMKDNDIRKIEYDKYVLNRICELIERLGLDKLLNQIHKKDMPDKDEAWKIIKSIDPDTDKMPEMNTMSHWRNYIIKKLKDLFNHSKHNKVFDEKQTRLKKPKKKDFRAKSRMTKEEEIVYNKALEEYNQVDNTRPMVYSIDIEYGNQQKEVFNYRQRFSFDSN